MFPCVVASLGLLFAAQAPAPPLAPLSLDPELKQELRLQGSWELESLERTARRWTQKNSKDRASYSWQITSFCADPKNS
jgi:hypothetical protein